MSWAMDEMWLGAFFSIENAEKRLSNLNYRQISAPPDERKVPTAWSVRVSLHGLQPRTHVRRKARKGSCSERAARAVADDHMGSGVPVRSASALDKRKWRAR
ncbi:SubName: Full=Uncharacterized protein {ECO:0000313/EMBL:CCA72707.1} [Serendipita indica DSM 11827]|uniref:Uncharacterized protein n=1 Tax=Serendipita indica (strain DSM 11827) TaxID=1109443 RepID=G4TN20_SERID|nr:SubName: Full=Uncharacterized protein {ECO:0000313/EMBL:CCA72707.1} [Serendipita indica DSM 11827]CCA72707.1 hypothetical protein PIIN_06644 [Serendipita indica DSM 11827]